MSGDICSVHIMREPESLSEGLDTESVGTTLEVLKQGSSTVRCVFQKQLFNYHVENRLGWVRHGGSYNTQGKNMN